MTAIITLTEGEIKRALLEFVERQGWAVKSADVRTEKKLVEDTVVVATVTVEAKK